MEKEETQNREDQNIKNENSDLSKDKQASDENGEREDKEQLSPEDETGIKEEDKVNNKVNLPISISSIKN